MAVFMLNICKFNDCGITFQNLGDLIQHIEDNHIDYDPHIIEEKEQQQPSCLPLSYILRFFPDSAKKEVSDMKPKMKTTVEKSAHPQPAIPTNPTESPQKKGPSLVPGSEGDDDDIGSESEDSNDSWSTQEEFSSEFILKYGSKMVSPSTLPDGTVIEKPFACPVPGCKKRYKNVNGIKYHSKNGHKNEGKVRKGFKCYCGKSYKTNGGLKNHTALMHSGTTMTTIATQNGTPQVLQIPTLQPIRTLTLKHIASLGLPVKTLVVATKSQDKAAKTTSNLGVLTPATSPNSPDKPNEIPIPEN
ncbi:juxtaposed with another zinc finger protein 1 isoform X1 [Cimex lectularius]|uniref:C2H2-type domain-containing protein n=1 Tax=Cimex lectularius TaxID=79782 RepID=A0A8I6RNB5_CIMLE|nr:juxtaposed with another zinc finger protein 1 isoform X1 [Cimex lectularius]